MLRRALVVTVCTAALTAVMASSDGWQETAIAKQQNAGMFEGTWSSTDGRRIRIDDMGAFLSIKEIRKNGTYGISMNAVLSNSSSEECGTQGGWFYDDPTSDSKIKICPGRCASLITEVASSRKSKRHNSRKRKSR